MIRSIFVSPDAMKSWSLHGPIDQALKTSIQADGIKCFSIDVEVSGLPYSLDLWVDNDQPQEIDILMLMSGSINKVAQAILVHSVLRKEGILYQDVDDETLLDGLRQAIGRGLTDIINGNAVLTGAGGQDIPDVEPSKLVSALLGQEIDF